MKKAHANQQHRTRFLQEQQTIAEVKAHKNKIGEMMSLYTRELAKMKDTITKQQRQLQTQLEEKRVLREKSTEGASHYLQALNTVRKKDEMLRAALEQKQVAEQRLQEMEAQRQLDASFQRSVMQRLQNDYAQTTAARDDSPQPSVMERLQHAYADSVAARQVLELLTTDRVQRQAGPQTAVIGCETEGTLVQDSVRPFRSVRKLNSHDIVLYSEPRALDGQVSKLVRSSRPLCLFIR